MIDPELKTAVERMHNCTASFIEDVVVLEKYGNEPVWSGMVSVFNTRAIHKPPKHMRGHHQ